MTLGLVTRSALHNVLAGAVIVGAGSTATTAFATVGTLVGYTVDGSTRLVVTGPPFQTLLGPLTDSDAIESLVGAPVFLHQTLQNQVAGGDGISGADIDVAAGAAIGQFQLSAIGTVLQKYARGAQLGRSSITTEVSAHWNDTIRLSAGNTTKAILHGKFNVHGTFGASATALIDKSSILPVNPSPTRNWAAAQMGFHITMRGGLTYPLEADPVVIPNFGQFHAAVRDTTSPVQPQYDHPLPQSIPYEIVVTPDVTFPLEVGAFLRVQATALNDSAFFGIYGSYSALFAGELGNTISWGGIDSVTNADTGEPIENWTITSESGFDYSRPFPIPEPSAAWLFVAGLAGLAVSRRSRAALKTHRAKCFLLPTSTMRAARDF